MAHRLASASLSTFVCCLALTGCNTPVVVAPTDGGTDAWMHADASLTPDSCDMEHLHALEGVAGGMVSIDLDTTMTTTRPRDLGGCGNTAADIRWANQEVVALHVPGTGMQGVQFTTSNSMTAVDFNTLIQVRQGDCRAIPTATFPPSCFDDISATNLDSQGGITVMGGTTLYFFITGYSHPPAGQMSVDHGVVHVDFAVAANTAPTLTAGTATFARADTILTATATDPEGALGGYSISFYNAAGQIDISGDGMATSLDALTFSFDTVDRAAPMYTGHATLAATAGYTIVAFCTQAAVNCTQVGLRVFDQQYAVSNELRVDIHPAAFVGVGATCDTLHLCPDGLTCTGGACAVIPGATTECAGALQLAIDGTALTGHVQGTVGSGMGVFQASCAATAGREQIWHFVVPTGTYDLALTTQTTGTNATADTVLSVRSVCTDQTTELAMGCNDDINLSGMNYRSAIAVQNVAAGDYYAFVEVFGSNDATPYGLAATLTPVLAMGAACDPAMHNYRCANGACSATTMLCP